MLGKLIVDLATGAASEPPVDAGKDPAAVSLGRRGGLKGGPARAAKMTPAERRESARQAARARWAKRETASPVEPERSVAALNALRQAYPEDLALNGNKLRSDARREGWSLEEIEEAANTHARHSGP